MAYECPCLKKNKKPAQSGQVGAPAAPCGPGYVVDPRTNQCVPDPRQPSRPR